MEKMISPTLLIRRLPHASGLPVPAYQTAGAAGIDLSAALERPLTLRPGDSAVIPTGIAAEIPGEFVGLVRGRSGMAFKRGLWAFEGTIDADYRGEISVLVRNFGQDEIVIGRGERVAQLVIMPAARCTIVEADALGATDRGMRGFGSTGA